VFGARKLLILDEMVNVRPDSLRTARVRDETRRPLRNVVTFRHWTFAPFGSVQERFTTWR